MSRLGLLSDLKGSFRQGVVYQLDQGGLGGSGSRPVSALIRKFVGGPGGSDVAGP